MKLLICTQKVDINDSDLGFFHEWLLRLAGKVDKLTIICLEKGEYNLPENVEVLSLGKNELRIKNYELWFGNKIRYAFRFYKYIWQERKNYDGVFVHMNPEYCILGGIFWRLWHKKILLWYTHKAVNLRLRLGTLFTNRVFTPSKESFRLKSKKVEVVGHGIPVEIYSKHSSAPPLTEEILLLSVGRITSSKDVETIIRAVSEISKHLGLPRFTIDFVGDAITKEDYKYKERMYKLDKELNIWDAVNSTGHKPVVNFKGVLLGEELEKEYQSRHILIHTSRTGSMDKVVLEAMASGRIVVTSSEAYADLAEKGLVYTFPAGDYQELAKIIAKIYQSGIIIPNEKAVEYVRKNHNLDALITKIIGYFNDL